MSLVPNTREAKASGSLNSRTARSITKYTEKFKKQKQTKRINFYLCVTFLTGRGAVWMCVCLRERLIDN